MSLTSRSSVPAADQTGTADVCLLLEGTWPYVRGGVSTWVHQILTALPELRFSVVYIGAEKSLAGERKYDLPPNLASLHEIFLFDPSPDESAAISPSIRVGRTEWQAVHSSLAALLLSDEPAAPESIDSRLAEALLALARLAQGVTFERFWQHPDTWDLLLDCYARHFEQLPFIDFFWNVRFLIEPVWKLLRIEENLPEAAVYHSVSTGYAGLLGALAARRRPRSRFLLSEHGIYVRERISDLLRSEWAGPDALRVPGTEGIPALRRLWIDFFVEIGRLTYHSAARIVSLFQRNAHIQTEFGAPAERQQVIPNGVDLSRFEAIRESRREKRLAQPGRRHVGFFGRVVAIKDVKTLLRAARLTIDAVPDARFLIVGPTDEDAAYFAECETLTAELGLSEHVLFTGPASPETALPEFDIMVLSSVSEGLPFAVLEAFGAGMPVVSTDVGSCAELIHGRDDEQPALGPAGAVVPVGNPPALAQALIRLLSDRELQDRCGAAGLARTRQSYTESGVIDHYRELYVGLAAAATA